MTLSYLIFFPTYIFPSAVHTFPLYPSHSPTSMTGTTCQHKGKILPQWQMIVFIKSEHIEGCSYPHRPYTSVLINPSFRRSLTARLTVVSDSFRSLTMVGTVGQHCPFWSVRSARQIKRSTYLSLHKYMDPLSQYHSLFFMCHKCVI